MANLNGGRQDEVSWAYQILKQGGQAMYFRDLISEVVKMKGGLTSAHVLAEVHTQINMDSRFVHMGKGMWGLVDWSPQRSAKVTEDATGGTGIAESGNLRREKLLAAIQQDFEAPGNEQELAADDIAGDEIDDDDDGNDLEDAAHFADLSEINELDEEDDRP